MVEHKEEDINYSEDPFKGHKKEKSIKIDESEASLVNALDETYDNDLSSEALKEKESYKLLGKIYKIISDEGKIEFKIVNGHHISIPSDKYEFTYANINVGDSVCIEKKDGLYYISKLNQKEKVEETSLLDKLNDKVDRIDDKIQSESDGLLSHIFIPDNNKISVGVTIKKLSKLIFVVNVIVVFIYFFIAVTNQIGRFALFPSLIGLFGAWVVYLLLNGFGELIENTFLIKEELIKQNKHK